MPKKPKRLALLLSACLLTGCGTSGSEIKLTDTSCKSFRPIAGSTKDTDITKRQVIAHNKVYDTICPGKANG